MEFQSKELREATEVKSSFVVEEKIDYTIDIDSAIEKMILSKDKTLLVSYHYGKMNCTKNTTSTDVIKNVIKILKSRIIDTTNEQNTIKKLTIKKIFDSIIANIEALELLGCESKASDLAVSILGFLVKSDL